MSDIQAPNVFQSFNQGLGVGQNLRNVQLQNQAIQQQQAAQQQAAEKDARRNGLLSQLYSGNMDRGLITELIALTPKDQSDQMMAAINRMDSDRKGVEINKTAPIFAAVHAGNVEVAGRLIDEQVTALKNAGADQGEIKALEDMKTMINQGETGLHTAEYTLAQGLEMLGGGDIIDSVVELNKTRVDIPYKEAQTNKLNIEAKKLAQELEQKAQANQGILSEEDKRKAQIDIRTQFLKYNNTAMDAVTKLAKINAVADRAIANSTEEAAVQGVSDLALINSFQRLIDDGVVRGEDVELAMNTAGGGAKISNVFKNFTRGDVLTAAQREEFKAVANLLVQAEKDSMEIFKNIYANQIAKDGLDESYIYGGEVVETPRGAEVNEVAATTVAQPTVQPAPVVREIPPIVPVATETAVYDELEEEEW